MLFTIRLFLRELKEKVIVELSFLFPRWVVYRSIIRAWANATVGPYGNENPSDTLVHVMVDRWNTKNGDGRLFKKDPLLDKGTISCNVLWDEKPKWLAEIINANLTSGNQVTADWIRKTIPAGAISALLDVCGVTYKIDWAPYMDTIY